MPHSGYHRTPLQNVSASFESQQRRPWGHRKSTELLRRPFSIQRLCSSLPMPHPRPVSSWSPCARHGTAEAAGSQSPEEPGMRRNADRQSHLTTGRSLRRNSILKPTTRVGRLKPSLVLPVPVQGRLRKSLRAGAESTSAKRKTHERQNGLGSIRTLTSFLAG